MVLFGITLVRMSSRHGAEPMEDPVPRSLQHPGPTGGVSSVSSFLNPALLPHTIVACLYTIFVLGQIRKKLVRMNTRVVVEFLVLHLLTQNVVLDALGKGWALFGILSMICYINSHVLIEFLAVDNKAVLITGCDRGFGHALAIRLDQLGFRVFAGCLDKTGEGAVRLEAECSDRLKTIQLDITKDGDVEVGAQTVKAHLGDSDLWGIVNNAGICMAGNTEIMAMDDMKKIMEVNFWGPVRVCKSFLPLVRRGRGRVVNVASNAGLVPIPLMGAYCASKAAVASMTEIWRAELQAWGVKVSTVIPSGFNTGILAYDKSKMAEKWFEGASDVVKEDFGKEAFYVKPKAQGKEEKMLSSDLSLIVDVMVDALLSKAPKAFYYKGFLARSLPFLYTHFPTAVTDPLMKVVGDWFDTVTPRALQKQDPLVRRQRSRQERTHGNR